METPVEKATRILGGALSLAKLCSVSASFVYQWIEGTRAVPAKHAPLIESATRAAGDVVTAEELCPDFRWDIIRGSNKSVAA